MKNVDSYRILISHGFQHEEAETIINDLKNDKDLVTKNDLQLAVSEIKNEIKSTALTSVISITAIFAVFLSILAYFIK